jgi:hypothetical protein
LERTVKLGQPRGFGGREKIALAADVHDLVPTPHFVFVKDLNISRQIRAGNFGANSHTRLQCNQIAVLQVTAQTHLKQSVTYFQCGKVAAHTHLAERALADQLDGFKLRNACLLAAQAAALRLASSVDEESSRNLRGNCWIFEDVRGLGR